MIPALAAQDVDAMRESVFFEGPEAGRKLTRFWILLLLAATIAAAGVVADSTATVIGAMIVAPLMVPIQGTMLSVVIADRNNLARSIGLVVAGAASAVAIGYVVGLSVVNDVVAQTNSQVAGRVSPRLIDLLAALATGMVGSVALARRDISDTLPGVAIAISLVPPLSVVGLTLESGAGHEALGALLLFVTNVAAILATGTIVMALYGAHRITGRDDGFTALHRRKAVAVIAVMVVLVGIPLAVSSAALTRVTSLESTVHELGQEWADTVGWELVEVGTEADRLVVRFEGGLPVPEVG
ncbi:MAG: DUF389 domain-containing protein, partial [Ilumatobacteraceae bacterium]